MITLAAEAVYALSIFKPLLLAAAVIGWAKWATVLDKDAAYFHLPRRMLNGLTLAAGALAFVVWLFIPIYWIGLPVALLIIIGAGVGYAMFRNRKVAEEDRWQLNTELFRQFMANRQQGASERDTALRFIAFGSRSSANVVPVPERSDPAHTTHVDLDELITNAARRSAERIEIGVAGQDVTVQQVVDGVKYKLEPMDPSQTTAMIDYLKQQAGMDVQDRRRKQTAEVKITLGEMGQHDLRIGTAGSTRGISCVIEIDPRKQLDIDFDKLGLLESQHDQIKTVLAEAEGLVIVAAPPDQGRTVTMYALVQEHDPYLMDIHTIEQPVELDLEGITQHTPGEEGWSKTLSSLLLRDPAVVMLSQVPDEQTAKVAAQAAIDHKRIYVGLRANDTLAALRAWAKALGDLKMTGDCLRAIVSQRLIRKLCPVCRQAYQPDPAVLRKLNLPANRIEQMYKASGKVNVGNKTQPCPTCNGMGYLGRTAAFEVMVLDEGARGFIRNGDMNGLRAHVRKQKMLWLQEAALAKVVSGETSVTEVMRALGGAAPEPAKPANSG